MDYIAFALVVVAAFGCDLVSDLHNWTGPKGKGWDENVAGVMIAFLVFMVWKQIAPFIHH